MGGSNFNYDRFNLPFASSNIELCISWIKMAMEAGRIAFWEYNPTEDALRYYADPENMTLLGLDPHLETISLKDRVALLDPDIGDYAYKAMLDAVETGKEFKVDYKIRTIKGDTRWISARGLPQPNTRAEGKPRIVGTSLDITELKEAEFALQSANFYLEHSNKIKSRFLSTLGHELRGPLHSIIGLTDLILQSDSLKDEDKQNLNQISLSGSHILTVLDDVLDIAKVEAGFFDLNEEPLNAVEVINEAIDILSGLARNYSVKILSPPKFKTVVYTDHKRLRQILINFISNAVKYNKPNGTVSFELTKVDDKVKILVKDSGVGISVEYSDRIYRQFDRLSKDVSNIQGFGLGLAVCKSLSEAMDCEIGYDSKLGEGSSFWIQVPVAKKGDIASNDSKQTTLPKVQEKIKIVYIEDDLIHQKLLKASSNKLPMEVFVASTGKEGIKLIKEHHADVVVLDINLEDMTGREVLTLIRSDIEISNVPGVAISASATDTQVQRVMAAGADIFVRKPVLIKDLVAAIYKVTKPNWR